MAAAVRTDCDSFPAKGKAKGKAPSARVTRRREDEARLWWLMVWVVGSVTAFYPTAILATCANTQALSWDAFLQSTALLLLAVFAATQPVYTANECVGFAPDLLTFDFHNVEVSFFELPLLWLLGWRLLR